MTNSRLFILGTSLLLFNACAEKPSPLPGSNPERPLISAEQCTNKGGHVVGDIGDGRVHRDDFLCPNNQLPIGTIEAEQGKRSLEGAVCCLR